MPAAKENEISVNHLISDITHGYCICILQYLSTTQMVFSISEN